MVTAPSMAAEGPPDEAVAGLSIADRAVCDGKTAPLLMLPSEVQQIIVGFVSPCHDCFQTRTQANLIIVAANSPRAVHHFVSDLQDSPGNRTPNTLQAYRPEGTIKVVTPWLPRGALGFCWRGSTTHH